MIRRALSQPIFLVLAAPLMAMVACNVYDGSDEVSNVRQDFSAASCASVTANQTFQWDIVPPFVSPQTYNKCTKSYVVDITPLGVGGANGTTSFGDPHGVRVEWGDATPLTQAVCEDIEGAALFYERSSPSDPWAQTRDTQSAVGRWTNLIFFSACSLPKFTFHPSSVFSSVRVAATMRLMSGTNPTRQIKFSTVDP